MNQAIAIIDLGGQYCGLIARRLRDLGVQSTVFPPSVIPGVLKSFSGIILSGGPRSVYEPDAPTLSPSILALGVPILGLCFGFQLIAKLFGATVEPGQGEYGATELRVIDQDTLFLNTPRQQTVWASHGDRVTALPPSLTLLAETANGQIAAFRNWDRTIRGLSFHPEVSQTLWGHEILRNFVFSVCKVLPALEVKNEVRELVEGIRARVQDLSVFCLLSGGLDSTVAFVLCAQALPKGRLLGVHVDSGLMPRGETERLLDTMKELGLADRVHVQHEAQRFFYRLMGVEDPEEKRRVIGRLFVTIQAEAMEDYGIEPARWLLMQGTLASDAIESGGSAGLAAVIKTHHNRCPEIQELIQQGRVIEPLKSLYKDEVRRIGRALGLPPKLLNKWPFPGPGLAVRILGPVTAERVAIVQQADEIIEAEIRAAGLYESLWQAFAVLLPVQSVGVKGDQRSYGEVIAIRAVYSNDGMTANWAASLPPELLGRLATRIVNEIPGINRVVYDVTNKPPATIEWE